MLVNGKMDVQVEISALEAIKVIKDSLGITETSISTFEVLKADHEDNQCGKEAIYRVTDISRHGSWTGEYELITWNPEKVAIFKAFQTLEKAIKENKTIKK